MYDLYVDDELNVFVNEWGDPITDDYDPDYEAELMNNNYEGDVFGDCGER